jgi:hypothetical protein
MILEVYFVGAGVTRLKFRISPKTEMRTADYADFTDDKRVSSSARALDSFLFIRAIRAIRSFNFRSRF